MAFVIEPPVEPMLAKLAREFPVQPGLIFEPKWDGFRCLVFRSGDELYLQSRNAKPLLRYFPELRAPLLEGLPDRCVFDGELVVIADEGLSFDALQLRQHPADSRVRRLAEEIPATFVAFDVLAAEGEVLLNVPFATRRERLVAMARRWQRPLILTPATAAPAVGADWFDRFEGAGFDGVIAKPEGGRYEPGRRSLIKVKHERTCDCVVAGYRIHKDGAGVGSLLLGLHDDEGRLHHVGVAASLDAATRGSLLAVVEALREGALADHPWRDWAEFAAPGSVHDDPDAPELRADRRMPGAGNRWNAAKDMSWLPVRRELVAEVAYEGLMGGRFRHNARLRRLRRDRDPESCTYRQLDAVTPNELSALLG